MPLQPHLEPRSLGETVDSMSDGVFIFTPLKLGEDTENSESRPDVGMLVLTLKAPITTAADDILKYFSFIFQRKQVLIFHGQTIHMKYQDLFSLKN